MPEDPEPPPPVGPGGPGRFTQTRWSAVMAAGGDDPDRAEAALAELCQAYWYPLYAFVRRSGYPPPESEDLTQEFFRRLIEKRWLGLADPARGRFRSFLLSALRHFLANEWHRQNRQKRGGGTTLVSIDAVDAEERYTREPAHSVTPERLYERRWAEALLGKVLDRIESEYRTHPLGFESLQVYLVDRGESPRFADAAARLGVTEAALKSVVHKLRQRYRRIFLEEIAHTLGPEEDAETEARALLRALDPA